METYGNAWQFILFWGGVSLTFHASIHFAVLPTATKLWDFFAYADRG